MYTSPYEEIKLADFKGISYLWYSLILSTNKNDRHIIAEIILKVVLTTLTILITKISINFSLT
jgi:hypothetical protein